MKIKNNQKGFTFLEIMLVIAILSITVGFFVLYSNNSQIIADVNNQANIIVSHIRLVQSNADSGYANTASAIHLDTNSYTGFIGPIYNPLDSSNYTMDLPGVLSIQNVSLNGGGSDIVFVSPRGETANYGSFNLTAADINKSITINISQNGAIDY